MPALGTYWEIPQAPAYSWAGNYCLVLPREGCSFSVVSALSGNVLWSFRVLSLPTQWTTLRTLLQEQVAQSTTSSVYGTCFILDKNSGHLNCVKPLVHYVTAERLQKRDDCGETLITLAAISCQDHAIVSPLMGIHWPNGLLDPYLMMFPGLRRFGVLSPAIFATCTTFHAQRQYYEYDLQGGAQRGLLPTVSTATCSDGQDALSLVCTGGARSGAAFLESLDGLTLLNVFAFACDMVTLMELYAVSTELRRLVSDPIFLVNMRLPLSWCRCQSLCLSQCLHAFAAQNYPLQRQLRSPGCLPSTHCCWNSSRSRCRRFNVWMASATINAQKQYYPLTHCFQGGASNNNGTCLFDLDQLSIAHIFTFASIETFAHCYAVSTIVKHITPYSVMICCFFAFFEDLLLGMIFLNIFLRWVGGAFLMGKPKVEAKLQKNRWWRISEVALFEITFCWPSCLLPWLLVGWWLVVG